MNENTSIIEVSSKGDLTNPIRFVKQDIRKYWIKEQIDSMLESINNHRHKMLIRFLWMSGVRITEAINLKKGDIDFNNYLMKVKWLKSRKWNERVLPIHPTLKNILEVYTAPLKESDLIFPISRQRAWQLTKKYLEGHPHQLRHSFAVHWLKSKGDITILHRILGHSKIQTTMEYLKIVPIDQGKELLKLEF
jgi:integrase/recombinase XerD